MKPAFSIVVFTVLSGAGLGLAMMLALFGGEGDNFWRALQVSVLLTGGGLLASVGHLANPKNAWRAMMRFRSSWLSREAVLAVVFFMLAALWAWQHYKNDSANVYLSAAVGLCALATVFCTAMIYQSLKPIPAWHHPITSVNYVAFSLMSGAALFGAIAQNQHAAVVVLISGAVAMIGKLFHYRRAGKAQNIRVGRATGFTQAKAKLLEAGHTGATFLTREFIFEASARFLSRMRAAAMLLCFVPVFAAAGAQLVSDGASFALALALPLMFAGLLCERWLFFAEAKHVVRAYHGIAKP